MDRELPNWMSTVNTAADKALGGGGGGEESAADGGAIPARLPEGLYKGAGGWTHLVTPDGEILTFKDGDPTPRKPDDRQAEAIVSEIRKKIESGGGADGELPSEDGPSFKDPGDLASAEEDVGGPEFKDPGSLASADEAPTGEMEMAQAMLDDKDDKDDKGSKGVEPIEMLSDPRGDTPGEIVKFYAEAPGAILGKTADNIKKGAGAALDAGRGLKGVLSDIGDKYFSKEEDEGEDEDEVDASDGIDSREARKLMNKATPR